jgi:uncharacterized protein (UPF0335 family)
MRVHISIGQYEFIEADVETPQEAKDLSDDIKATFKECYGQGLDPKTFNKVVERYLTEGTMEADLYTSMNKEQMDWVQVTKRAFARLKSK